MVYTRFGSPVRIIGVIAPEDDSYPQWVIVKYEEFAGTREVHISDLKADDIHEITDPLDRWVKEHRTDG